ncbi:hypothetical protein BBOV_III010850 [Babesia bovis T2Bo]|uniref:Gamma tubulin complex component C-terminal domain-containing protein n=1 Tax=Babesia bovis TaxID=5865 RepID=A7AQ03_BABBO|nr:hypothetical protein BBOV_III010850 [Babesia bovis T2Bo]EDO08637.1 hypothetical protein BBOV_III010850 [Babesia bovis T2Bo]|eukprot:XP_001612205.1 hypothetical protein [Babesia bovis T2Bo]
MELKKYVRLLADTISELSSDEIDAIEQRGLSPQDVKVKLSRHIVDQIWSHLLRPSLHFPTCSDQSNKSSRYSASRILEDIELSVKQKIAVQKSLTSGSTDKPFVHSNVTDDGYRAAYQSKDIFIQVALRMHREALLRKGLYLELISLDMLLQLVGSISHMPVKYNIDGSIPVFQRDDWYRFTCIDSVLEMLCHLSSEPDSCVGSLELSRYILLRKGIREVRNLDTKSILGLLNDPGLRHNDASKWISCHHVAPRMPHAASVISERWTSIAFDQALSKIPNIGPSTNLSDSTALGLRNLSISQSFIADPMAVSINDGWLSCSSGQIIDSYSDASIIRTKTLINEVNIWSDKASTNWIYPSARPSGFDTDRTAIVEADDRLTIQEIGSVKRAKVQKSTPIKWMREYINKSMTTLYPFSLIDPRLIPSIRIYSSWQCLQSFDSASLFSNLRHSGSDRMSQGCILESMAGFTFMNILKHDYTESDFLDSVLSDWYSCIVLCLRGIESALFACEAVCLYAKDPSLVPDHVHRWVSDGTTAFCRIPRVICHALVHDMMSSDNVSENALVSISPDGRFVIFPGLLDTKSHDGLALLTRLAPSPQLEQVIGRRSTEPIFTEFARLGSITRDMNIAIESVRNIEAAGDASRLIGTTLSVYMSSISSFIDNFESTVGTYVGNDQSGDTVATSSVVSLLFNRLDPWVKAIDWFKAVDISLTDENGQYHLARGGYLLDRLLAHYIGSYGIWFFDESIGGVYAYRCLISCMKPYLSFMSEWVTGSTDIDLCSEFHQDSMAYLIAPLVSLENVIVMSREMSVFLRTHYPSQMTGARPLFGCILNDNESDSWSMGHDANNNIADSKPLQELFTTFSRELLGNHAWLNLQLVSLLKTEYHLFEVIEDIHRFVLLSRRDMLETIFDEWRVGCNSGSYSKLFRGPLQVEVKVANTAEFFRDGVSLTFSCGIFDRLLFSEETRHCYTVVFNLLCAVHFGMRHIMEVSKWLCLSYRGSQGLSSQGCAPIIRMICTLTREMHSFFSILEWFFHYGSIYPLYTAFISRLKGTLNFSDVVMLHSAFARDLRASCMVSRESRHCSILLRSMCYCTSVLRDMILGESSGVLQDTSHVEYWLSLESPLIELSSKFSGFKQEFLFVVNSSHDPTQFQLATVLDAGLHPMKT